MIPKSGARFSDKNIRDNLKIMRNNLKPVQGTSRHLPMNRKNVVGDHFDRDCQYRGVIGKPNHRQHVRNRVERQHEIGNGRDQRVAFACIGVLWSKAQ
jgi:hypothetical protein